MTMTKLSRADLAVLNEALFEQLTTPGMEKQAVSALEDYTRTTMREDGFTDKLIPPQKVENSDLDKQADTDNPVKIFEKEPGAQAAITVGFATLPNGLYIRGPKYRANFCRILSPCYNKDVDQLRTYTMDIRQILSDDAMKDMMAEKDANFVGACNAAMLGADVPVPHNDDVPLWETIASGLTREAIADMLMIMPRGPSHLEVHTCVINNVTVKELMKWGFDEMGGSDLAADIVKNGWAETEFMGCRWIVTIKRGLINDNTIMMYADPAYIGKNLYLEEPVMWVKNEMFMVKFCLYQTVGGAFGHVGGLCRADFE